jgi:murein DD-endopeptidase MepM/ murein hydrolase activator NlpD
MRATATTLRRTAAAAAICALFGLTACADPAMQGALDSFVTSMRTANAATKATVQADALPATDAVAPPAVELVSVPSAPPSVPSPAASDAVSAPAAKAAAAAMAARPAEATGRAAAATDLGTLQRQLNELESRVAALTAENQRQMERLSLMTNGAIADMEQLFNSLRLELRSAPGSEPAPAPTLKRRRPSPSVSQVPSGQGGPFLPWPPKASVRHVIHGEPVEPLLPDLQTLFLLHQIVMALPLAAPLDEAVVTGPYGYRRDPFNRRSAFHDGIDLQAPMRTAVHASAAGVVVVAGMRPAYGRVVEIDHGFGILTRYAHLATLAVREGDRVERHTLIGALGSSGRSASPHLHYEVLFNGRPHDPADLLVLAEGIRPLR